MAARAVKQSAIDAEALVSFHVHLRRKAGSAGPASLDDHFHGLIKPLSHDDFERLHGADDADIAMIRQFAAGNNLVVEEVRPAARIVTLRGSVKSVNQAFGITLGRYFEPHKAVYFRGYEGEVHVPASLAGLMVAVLGLDTFPAFRPHVVSTAPQAPYLPTEVASFYSFPDTVTGKGQGIGIIELGGGYDATVLQDYFTNTLQLSMPAITDIGIDGATNQPGALPNFNAFNDEVYLDMEIAGAVANDAALHVYFCNATTSSFVNGVAAAVHDTVNKNTVISISWGEMETAPGSGSPASLCQTFITAMEAQLQDAAALGITVCVSTGDFGANCGSFNPLYGTGDQQAHVNYPASSPWVLACGGTTIFTTGNTITAEYVWNTFNNGNGKGTGGGISVYNTSPLYQINNKISTVSANDYPIGGTAPVTGNAATSSPLPASQNTNGNMRGIPDVAAFANNTQGYLISYDNITAGLGGTSAATPLWAGLIALMNEQLGRSAGFLNPLLYGQQAVQQALNDIVVSSAPNATNNNINGYGFAGYTAGPGWDACTGWGSPNGKKLVAALQACFAAAGA